jgi:hydrogenase maturation factor
MRIGKATESILNRSVLKLIRDKNKKSAVYNCAYSIDDEAVMASAISTLAAPVQNVGYYAVYNAINNLYADGITPEMAMINIMLPEQAEESELKQISRDCKRAADELGIPIRGGHTEVTDALTRPLVSAVVSGRSKKDASFSNSPAKVKDGDAIIMTKWAGIEGSAILADECHDRLKERLPEYIISETSGLKKYISVREEADIARKLKAPFIHDISSGGVFAALWELGTRAGCGFKVDLKAIPMRQEIIEVTNCLLVNPYLLASNGSLLFITDEEELAIRRLEEAGIPAAVIGRVCDGNDRLIINDGEKRFLDKPAADELLRIDELRTK